MKMKNKIKKILEKLVKILKSRTFWTLVVTLIFNIIVIFGKFIPNDIIVAGNAFLTVMATYFHINPSQNYSKKIEEQIREEQKQEDFIESSEDNMNLPNQQ